MAPLPDSARSRALRRPVSTHEMGQYQGPLVLDVVVAAAVGPQRGQFFLEFRAVHDVEALAFAPNQAGRVELAERARDRLPGRAHAAGDLAQRRQGMDDPQVRHELGDQTRVIEGQVLDIDIPAE